MQERARQCVSAATRYKDEWALPVRAFEIWLLNWKKIACRDESVRSFQTRLENLSAEELNDGVFNF